MNDTSWDDGPWIVEVKRTFEISGCGPDDAAFWARIESGSPMDEGMRTRPEIRSVSVKTMVSPASAEPFLLDRLEDG